MLKKWWSKLRLKSAVLHVGATLALFAILPHIPFIQQLDVGLNDHILQKNDTIGSPDIVILEIDERTKDDAGNYPLSRDYIADVIENITKIHPKKILFDGILVADGIESHDTRLAMAIEKLGPEKIAIAGLNKTEQKPELRPNDQFASASTVFAAGFLTDFDGKHRAVATGSGDEQTLVNPARWLAGEASKEPVIVDQGIDPNSYLRLPISEFKGQADLNLINKVFIIGEAADLTQSKVNYPSETIISRATLLALGADTVMQGRNFFSLDRNTILKMLLAFGAIAAAMVLIVKSKKHLLIGASTGSALIITVSLIGLSFLDALMNVTLLLLAWNSAVVVALAYKQKLIEIIYDFWKGDLSAQEAKAWREWRHSDKPLLLLSVHGIKRMNKHAVTLGITRKDPETIDAIRVIGSQLEKDETKAVAFQLQGEKHLISISKPYNQPSLIQLEDITEADEAPDRLAAVFEVDPLTKCSNQAGFMKALRAFVKLKDPVSIFKLELMGYSHIEDLYGDEGTRTLLLKAAECFKDHLREGDHIARLKDNEFAIILEGKQSENYLQSMRTSFEDALGNHVRINGHLMAIGVCAGFVQSDGSESCVTLIEAVDQSKRDRKDHFKLGGLKIAQIEQRAA